MSRAHHHAEAIDLAIGASLREERAENKLTQDAIGKAIGITFQQVQKHERGVNRIAVSTLLDMERSGLINATKVIRRAQAKLNSQDSA